MDRFDRDRARFRELKRSAKAHTTAGELETGLDYARVAAHFAWQNALGWKDDELDESLVTIGEQIETETVQHDSVDVMFIASHVADAGGHSEALRLWSKMLEERSQALLLTQSMNSEASAPTFLEEISDRRVDCLSLDPAESYVRRIGRLKGMIESLDPDVVVLFIDPDDVVAVAGMADASSERRICFFNHADHVFWIGRSIIDRLIEFRPSGGAVSEELRNIEPSTVVPLTTDISPVEADKSTFDIPTEATLSVSIGSYYKTCLSNEWDYWGAIKELLRENPSMHHLFVTNPPERIEQDLPSDSDVRDRIFVRGPIADLTQVYSVGDVLLETFPMPGGMVQVEAMASCLPVVAFTHPEFPWFSEIGLLPEAYDYRFSTEEQLVDVATKLVRNKKERNEVGETLRERFEQRFSPPVIQAKLERVLFEDEFERNSDNVGTYDVEFDQTRYAEFSHSESRLNRTLLDQSIMKRSNFGFMKRIQFLSNALSEDEILPANVEFGGYLLAAILGRPGYQIARWLQNNMQQHT